MRKSDLKAASGLQDHAACLGRELVDWSKPTTIRESTQVSKELLIF